MKHLDFILLDELCLQISFIAAFFLRQRSLSPYASDLYREIAILLALFDLLVAVMADSMQQVLKRGYYIEFAQSFKHCLMVFLLTILWMFTQKSSDEYSRLVLFLTFMFHLGLGYSVRLLWKRRVKKRLASEKGRHPMLAVVDLAHAEQVIRMLEGSFLDGYRLSALVIADGAENEAYRPFLERLPADSQGRPLILSVPVVCELDEAAGYICREWIDCVYISCPNDSPAVRTFIGHCMEMAVTIHYHVPGLGRETARQFVETIGDSTVVTNSVHTAPPGQLVLKRLMDIFGGLIGSLLTLPVIAVVGPLIKRQSPGPVLYRSERIGQNGKRFQMLKIRSMHPGAEERKPSLMDQNRVPDGRMFKLDFDPRIIGNEELPDGTRKTGIGEWIRRASLDEFPQFFNVLKGDMSLVGTRPPTPDEWEKYEYHHRARLATKPGMTGMWQVSGRSEITDFEEVVRLDTAYIQNWSLGLDIKIMLKTVLKLISGKGAL